MDENSKTPSDLSCLKPITDEEIENLGLSVSDLWMIKYEESKNSRGPFSTSYLNEKSKDYPELFEKIHVYNLVIEKWKDFYTTTEFQRRRPKLVPAQNLIQNETFTVLSNGQKKGPLKIKDIKKLLDEDRLTLSDELSVDNGKTWIKIFEHHLFDRRLLKKSAQLPYMPKKEIFKNFKNLSSLELKRSQNKKDEQLAMTGLAFIGRGNDKGQVISIDEAIQKSKAASTEHQSTRKTQGLSKFSLFKYKKIAISLSACLVVVLSIAGMNFKSTFFGEGYDNKHAKSQANKSRNNRLPANFNKTSVKKRHKNHKKGPQGLTRRRNSLNKRQATKRQQRSHQALNSRLKSKAQRAKRVQQFHPKKLNNQNDRSVVENDRDNNYPQEQVREYEDLDLDDPDVREGLSNELTGSDVDKRFERSYAAPSKNEGRFPGYTDNSAPGDEDSYMDTPLSENFDSEIAPDYKDNSSQDFQDYDEFTDFE